MPFSLLDPLHTFPIAVLDFETTGTSAHLGHRVIEVGLLRIENGQIISKYQQLINPGRPISPAITSITGITYAMLQDQPSFAQQFPQMLPHLQNAAILGHNIPFDLSFLHHECHRCNFSLENQLGKIPVLDTVKIACRRFGRGGNSLPILAQRLGIQVPLSHRALADVETTAAVFQTLLQPLGGFSTSLFETYLAQGGPIPLLQPAAQFLPWALEEALDLQQPVLMEYLDARQSLTRRIIHPLQIRRRGQELILKAHCQLRGDQRTFKVERIVRLSRIDLNTGEVLDPPI